MELQGNNGVLSGCDETSFTDQKFLLNFIMSIYLGPDVDYDNPRRSAIQRIAEGLPPYTINHIGTSFVSISLLENLYYYILRNARPNLLLKPHLLHMYLKGCLPFQSSGLTEDHRQFTSFFPPNLHEQTWYPESHKNVKGIVLIADPVTSFISGEDVERFKSLSGLDNLKIDINEFRDYQGRCQEGTVDEQTCLRNVKETQEGKIPDGNGNLSAKFLETYKRRRHMNPQPSATYPRPVPIPMSQCHSKEGTLQLTSKSDGPAILPLLSIQNTEQCISDASIVLAGTAKKGTMGPPIGVVDIGVSKAAYFFQVALPGVKRDYHELSCEIESNGKVHLRGSTTGGKVIKKRSRVFQMKLQQLCPPGPFTLCFSLPGPVDPRLFSPNFRSDGIFEGVIVKQK